MPIKSSIRITNQNTKYTFTWTYKINNGGTVSYNSTDYNLSGSFPYYTPNIQIYNFNINYLIVLFFKCRTII